jgi:hypothetical protein
MWFVNDRKDESWLTKRLSAPASSLTDLPGRLLKPCLPQALEISDVPSQIASFFHQITIPVTAITTSRRLERDATMCEGNPRISPVWIERLKRITR